MSDIGLTVAEGVSNGLAPFTEPSKRNIGLLMERERGVENVPFRVNSLSDDAKRFGGFNANMYGPTIVRNLFKNAGNTPTTIYGIRIVGAGSTAATTGITAIQAVNHTYAAGQNGTADKGTWGNDLQVVFYSYNFKYLNKYAVEVYYLGILVEVHEGVTNAALQSTINTNSMYITATLSANYTDPTWVAGVGTITSTVSSSVITGVGTSFSSTICPVGSLIRDNLGNVLGQVAVITSTTSITLVQNATTATAGAAFDCYKRFSSTISLANGTYVAPVEANFYAVTLPTVRGLALFNGADIQILAVTENHTLTMAQELKTYAEGRADLIAVVNLPLNATETIVSQWATALQTSTRSYIAGYNVWVKTPDGLGNFVTVPGIGCVLGAAFLKVPFLQNDHIHIPPAGTDSAFTDIVEVYPATIDQPTLNLYTQNYTVNSVTFRTRLGYFVMTSRTYSTNSLYHSIHILMQTEFYVRVLNSNMGFAVQKPNTPSLKRDIYSVLFAYFKGEYEKGALEGTIPYKAACKIICDITNNPPTQSRKDLNADIDWIPTEATEAIKLRLNRNDGALLVSVVS